MRLSPTEANLIKEAISRYDLDAQVYLFGSRTDNLSLNLTTDSTDEHGYNESYQSTPNLFP